MNKTTNNSNLIEIHNKESLKELCSQFINGSKLILSFRWASRAIALFVVVALVQPLIFLGKFNSVSAQINSSSSSAPISAPPIAYQFGNETSGVFAPAMAISNSVSSVLAYVIPPTLPKGFEKAKPVSPFYQDVSSVASSISSSLGSVLGFVVNPTTTESNLTKMADGGFPSGAVPFDFDDDNYADVSRWNPSSGEWKVKDAQRNLTTETLGGATAVIVPGDFDGDDKTDKAVWTNGVWTIRKSSGGADVTHPFGTTGDVPVTGDYDGDGKSDYAIFRPSTNAWWIQQSSNNAVTSTAFGAAGDVTVPGDYDGDGITDKAVYRPSTGVWHITGSNLGYYTANWGISTDTPIPADFNGDGRTDYGIYRPSTGTWYIYYTDGTPYTATVWGNYGDQPVAADYDGDGKADLSVWRPKTGVWLIKESSGGTYKYETLDQTTVLKKVETEYVDDSAYISRRIIGLPSLSLSSGMENSSLNLVSKMTYAYDEDDFSDSTLEQDISPTSHDSTKYGAPFIVGRGNLTSTTNWNIAYPTNQSEAITSSVKYNTAGSPVASIDPMNRVIKTEYKDKFSDSPTDKSTYAYPTKIYDPDDNYSEVKYRYDLGVNVWAKSPAPEGPANQPNSQGTESIREYDSLGRLDKQTVVNNGAYTRHEYPNNQTESVTFLTVISGQGEVETRSYKDGAGRTLRTRTKNPNNITYGWTGVITEYDELGRVTRSTIPTEINPVSSTSWTPVEDDARLDGQGNLTFLWKAQKYDWKNRVVRKIDTDGVDSPTLNDSDVLISYSGCGCAGGQETTIENEYIRKTDWNGNVTQNLGRRKEKVYSDILGRTTKTEVYNWNGAVYNTVTNTYNGRDQVTKVREYEGLEFSSNFQETTSEYDGHGRIKQSHLPQQDSNKFTSYTYFADGKYQTSTDARGATTHYTYNSRGLADQISWTAPQGSNIEVPATVSFTYDAVGNRKSMTDGLGNVQYRYDGLSRLIDETRDFTDDVPAAPNPDSKFTLKYTYDLGGQLKTLEEPYGETMTYGYSETGQLKTVSSNRINQGTSVDYVTDMTYRAWGVVKKMNYSATSHYINEYDNRLQVSSWDSTSGAKLDYRYYSDGSLKNSDRYNQPKYDHSYEYDFLGRTTKAKSGIEARDGTVSNPKTERPFRHEYTYDAFSNMTQLKKHHWQATFITDETYSNGRITGDSVLQQLNLPCLTSSCVTTDRTSSHSAYDDEDGRTLGKTNDSYKFDAQGNLTNQTSSLHLSNENGINEIDYELDGDGAIAQKTKVGNNFGIPQGGYDEGQYFPYCEPGLELHAPANENEVACSKNYYFVNSSVLGQSVLEISEVEVDDAGVNDPEVVQIQAMLNIIVDGEVINQRKSTCSTSTNCNLSTAPTGSATINSDPNGEYTKVDYEPEMNTDPFGGVIGTNTMYEQPYIEECQYDYNDHNGQEYPFLACGEDPYPQNEATSNGSIATNDCYINNVQTDCTLAENFDHAIAPSNKNKDKPKVKPTLKKAKQRQKPMIKLLTAKEKIERRALKPIREAIAATGVYDDEGALDEEEYVDAPDTDVFALYVDKRKADSRIPISDIREAIQRVDKDLECKTFIKLLLDALSRGKRRKAYRSTNLTRVFDSVQRFSIDDGKGENNCNNGGACTYRSGNGAGNIIYSIYPPNPNARKNYFIQKGIAELIHLTKLKGDYTDRNLDYATELLIGKEGVENFKAFEKSEGKRKHPGNLGHFAVNVACKRILDKISGNR